jgi:uncharacterized protein (TIGR02466 family)
MIDNLFPTTVYYSDNNCVDDLTNYKIDCLKILEKVKYEKHPFGESSLKTTFWHPEFGHLYNLSEFQKLSKDIINQAVGFLNFLGFPGILPSDIEFLNMWTNLVEKHDYHAQHIHSTIGRSYLSGVFYIDAPRGATLEFGSPYRDAYSPVKPSVDNYSNYIMMQYDCIPGRLIMFKSNVYHGYNSHDMDESKISIPFNLAINVNK